MDHVTLAITRTAGTGGVKKHRCVKFDGTHPTTAGARILGVTEYKEAEGRPVSVAVLGTKLVEAGAAVAEGAEVSCDNQGRGITKPGSGSPFVFGEALGSAAKAGDLFEVLLTRHT